MDTQRVFVGFGFGAIQAGLFLYEAHAAGRFSRLVVSEVVPDVVDAVAAGGCCRVNIAGPEHVSVGEIPGIEILDPNRGSDRERLVEAVVDASEMATALPSVSLYETGGAADVAGILAEGLLRKAQRGRVRPAVLYAAENHNHAADLLAAALERRGVPDRAGLQCLDTVIGKMSGVVDDRDQIAEQGLATAAEGLPRAFLVEEFNRILISRVACQDFERGIGVFEEKADLLPFEEAKLYGHNATHALLGYLLQRRGCTFIAEARQYPRLLAFVRDAFIRESGKALVLKHEGRDRLFTEEGYREYADDLLDRMLRPHLRDRVARITRDPRRKLGWQDRLIGTIRLGRDHGVTCERYAAGAAAALIALAAEAQREPEDLLDEIWQAEDAPAEEKRDVRDAVLAAVPAAEDGALFG